MAIWVVLLALLCYASGLLTGWTLLQHLAYALACLFGLSFLFVVLSRRGLRGNVSADRLTLTAGGQLEETIALRKGGLVPALWTWIETSDGSRSFLGVLSGEERVWQRSRTFPYRGSYDIGGEVARVGDPFGLFSLAACTLDTLEVLVFPQPIPVSAARLSPLFTALRRPRWSMEDATLGDLRQYAPGDPPSRIHWRSTARTGSLVVSPPETRSKQVVWVAVDLGGGDEAADVSAGVAAHLVSSLHAARCEVGAFIAGAEVMTVPPQPGPDGPTAILSALARVNAADGPALETLGSVLARADRPAVVALISPHADRWDAIANLRRRAGSLVVIPAVRPEDETQ